MATQTAIKTFGTYDFARLKQMGSDDVLNIEDIKNEELQKAADAIRLLIRTGRLHIMDKEGGVAFAASVVVGYNGGLLIANER